jgi:MtfA peptidase
MNARDGHNVVLHEFAHQLDAEDGDMDGAPALPLRSMYTAWARVLGEEYADLSASVHRHRRTSIEFGGRSPPKPPISLRSIDAYGATNPPEFFAVVTEAFFETPKRLKRKHPELYEQLAAFYRQDPATEE